MLKFGVGLQAFEVIIIHQAIGIFKAAIDGFLQIRKRVIRTIGCGRDAGKGIPNGPAVPLCLGIVLLVLLLLDRVAKSLLASG